MTDETILSQIQYKGKDPNSATFWKECYHPDDVTSDMLSNGKAWYKYTVRFDGVKPVMITKSGIFKKASSGA